MQEFKKEKKFFNYLCELLFFMGVKEPELICCDIVVLLQEYFLNTKLLKIKLGLLLKDNKIFNTRVREEIISIYCHYVLNKKYITLSERKLKEIENFSRFKNIPTYNLGLKFIEQDYLELGIT